VLVGARATCEYIPFLLFDCFFFSTPLLLVASPAFSTVDFALVEAVFRLRVCLNGSGFGGASWDSMMGAAFKNTLGEGIVMVSAIRYQRLSRTIGTVAKAQSEKALAVLYSTRRFGKREDDDFQEKGFPPPGSNLAKPPRPPYRSACADRLWTACTSPVAACPALGWDLAGTHPASYENTVFGIGATIKQAIADQRASDCSRMFGLEDVEYQSLAGLSLVSSFSSARSQLTDFHALAPPHSTTRILRHRRRGVRNEDQHHHPLLLALTSS
jgi:hypothetical protein